jgi:uncharacterized membrane protein
MGHEEGRLNRRIYNVVRVLSIIVALIGLALVVAAVVIMGWESIWSPLTLLVTGVAGAVYTSYALAKDARADNGLDGA